ncbi:MAG: TIGR03016 family PEP-CTERM system-associated outer membrane protein [Desulfuromonadales bacterium]|nr:MAG: TIGR03016 family PEP-CTERM system-associated outer membrane protein [Desulfuromonadales bacterium]
MMPRNLATITGIVAFLMLVIATSVRAEFKLTPRISLREEYNDNIFLTSSNKKDDFITSITPSLGIAWKTSFLELSADYGLNFSFYVNNPDQNQSDLTQAQRAKVDTILTLLPETLFVKIADIYQRVPIDQRGPVAYDNVFVNLTDSNSLTVNPYLEYPITSTFKARLGYTYLNLWYKDSGGDNTQDHTANVGITKQFGERLTVFGDYSYKWHRPEKTFEYDSQTGSVGASLQVTPKLMVSGTVGQTFFKYKPATKQFPPQFLGYYWDGRTIYAVYYQPPAINTAPNDSSSTIWNAQVSYLLTDRVSLSTTYSQSFANTVDQGTVKNRTVTGSVSYNGKIPVTLSAFATNGTYTQIDREDRSAGATIATRMPLTSAITVKLDGSYTKYQFRPDGEDTNRYSARAGFDYALAFTTIGFGYTYNLNDSTVDINDYTNNIVFVQANFTY